MKTRKLTLFVLMLTLMLLPVVAFYRILGGGLFVDF